MIEAHIKALFGCDSSVPFNNHFCIENNLSFLRGHFYGTAEQNYCNQTEPKASKILSLKYRPRAYTTASQPHSSDSFPQPQVSILYEM